MFFTQFGMTLDCSKSIYFSYFNMLLSNNLRWLYRWQYTTLQSLDCQGMLMIFIDYSCRFDESIPCQ